MARVNVNECVFLEKYSVAPAPSRDYYGVRIAGNSLLLFVWRIARNHASFPTVRRELLDDFLSNTSMQNEISRLFGEELLSRVMAIARGDKDYLPNLPANLLNAILVNLDLRDIASVARACRKLAEVAKSNDLWKQLYLKYSVDTMPSDQRSRAKNIGWKKYFRANLHKTTIKNRCGGSAQKVAGPSVKQQPNKSSPRPGKVATGNQTKPANMKYKALGTHKDVHTRSDLNTLKSESKVTKLGKMSSDTNSVNTRLVTTEITLKTSEKSVGNLVGSESRGETKLSTPRSQIQSGKLEAQSSKLEAQSSKLSETKLSTPRSQIQSGKLEVQSSKLGNSWKSPINIAHRAGRVENNIEAECNSLAMEIKHTLKAITQPKMEKSPVKTDSKPAASNNHSATRVKVIKNTSDLTNVGSRMHSATRKLMQPERKTIMIENRFINEGKKHNVSEKRPETKLIKSHYDVTTSGSRLCHSTLKPTKSERETITGVLENRVSTANQNLTNKCSPGSLLRSSEVKTTSADKTNMTQTYSAVKLIKHDSLGIDDQKQNMSITKISGQRERFEQISSIKSKLGNTDSKVTKTVKKSESKDAKIVNISANLSLKTGRPVSKSESKPMKAKSKPNKSRSGLTKTERMPTTTGSKLT